MQVICYKRVFKNLVFHLRRTYIRALTFSHDTQIIGGVQSEEKEEKRRTIMKRKANEGTVDGHLLWWEGNRRGGTGAWSR
jgi:hypothetical protein